MKIEAVNLGGDADSIDIVCDQLHEERNTGNRVQAVVA
jgi:ADP-ribosylglycohydrolase